MSCCLQVTVNLEVLLLSRRVTAYNTAAVLGSVASWFAFTAAYSAVSSLSYHSLNTVCCVVY
jgi:hypothetical protein